MKRIIDFKLEPSQAALWFLGQSGFIFKSGRTTVVIDPYLSDSVGKVSPDLKRATAIPIEPSQLNVNIFIVTHDHLDHLDPETVGQYQHKDITVFVGPRFACRKLYELDVPLEQIVQIDSGETENVLGVEIKGVYTIPNEPSVIDTCGYCIKFGNGRSVYHTSDTDLSDLLLATAPNAEVGLFCINGQWGNLDVEKAVKLACKVKPKFAIPHHYDTMELNSVNPEKFAYCMGYTDKSIKVQIQKVMEPFVWGP